MLKKDLSSIYCDSMFSTIGHLVVVSEDCFTLECTLFITKISLWRDFELKHFLGSFDIYKLIASTSHSPIK